MSELQASDLDALEQWFGEHAMAVTHDQKMTIQAGDLAALVRAVREFMRMQFRGGAYGDTCAVCQRMSVHGHASDCRVGLALAPFRGEVLP